MYARITSTKGDPATVEQAIANFRDTIVPGAEAAPGFAGAVLHVDREKGLGRAVTLWDSLAAMNGAERLAQQLREQAQTATRGEILDVDRFEIALFERPSGEPQAPLHVRFTQLYGQPEKLDALVAYMRDEVLPQVKRLQGFRVLVVGVNRMTGRAFISASYASAADRDATEGSVAPLRSRAAETAGAGDVQVDLREVAVIKMRMPTPA